ncbi:MAG: glycoside hydrolase family 16 protein [Actinoplanes sp.]
MEDHFEGDELDRSIWVPWYLPHWSSRAQSTATYQVRDGELRLSIPPDQPLWAAGIHETPLRVSGIQSANFSGPVGSTIGGQPFADGQQVLEEQEHFWGYTPLYGHVEIRMRGVLTPSSMMAFWLSGIEDRPNRSGEICVAEIFGSAPEEIGIGVKAFRDPHLTQEFDTIHRPIDVSEFHTYAVDWRPDSLLFSIDGEMVKRIHQAPDYPVQLQLAVFDFPEKASPGDTSVPELIVSDVRGRHLDY